MDRKNNLPKFYSSLITKLLKSPVHNQINISYINGWAHSNQFVNLLTSQNKNQYTVLAIKKKKLTFEILCYTAYNVYLFCFCFITLTQMLYIYIYKYIYNFFIVLRNSFLLVLLLLPLFPYKLVNISFWTVSNLDIYLSSTKANTEKSRQIWGSRDMPGYIESKVVTLCATFP